MINQANRSFTTIDCDATNDIRRSRPVIDILQSVTVYNSKILNVKTFNRID